MKLRFRTIVADPPWPYGNAKRGAIIKTVKKDGSIAKGVHVHDSYATMDMPSLLALRPLASDNAHLYLWTTNAFVVEAHEIARAWGFVPKTIITWVKIKADGSPSMKTGYYFRGATEHILFAVRGSLPLSSREGHPTAILSPRLPHSVKPECFYQMVEECSPEARLEMFARRKRDGWFSWGNEVESDVRL